MIQYLKIIFISLFLTNILSISQAQNPSFDLWLNDFKKTAKSEGISDKTISEILSKSKFLPNVIKYDRYQPEFYEDTNTYVKKKTSK